MSKWFLSFSVCLFLSRVVFAGASLCVSSKEARLFSEPNLKAPVSWIVGQNMPLKKVSEKRGWFQVQDVDGEKHWIQSKNVSSKKSCLVIIRKKVKLRTGPGDNFPEAEAPLADRYTPFKDLQGEDGWTRVEDDFGNRGWVNLAHTWAAAESIRLDF